MRIPLCLIFVSLLALLAFFVNQAVYASLSIDNSSSATISANIQPTVNDIGVSKIGPASLFYFLKTVREGLEFKLALTPRVKMFRQLEFATRRLREVKSLIPTGRQDLIAPTLERYWFYINTLQGDNLKDQEVAMRVKEGLVVHLEVLEQTYNQVSNLSARMAFRTMINNISRRSDLPLFAKIPACNFLMKESSSTGLLEVEKEILSERASNCFKSAGYKF